MRVSAFDPKCIVKKLGDGNHVLSLMYFTESTLSCNVSSTFEIVVCTVVVCTVAFNGSPVNGLHYGKITGRKTRIYD